jgi:hypothetical protein
MIWMENNAPVGSPNPFVGVRRPSADNPFLAIIRCGSSNPQANQKHQQRYKSNQQGQAIHTPNEKEISHGTVSWQTRWTCIGIGPLASSTG